ncbi:MAG: plasmid pRiA4b ORF-3 family protein [Clostridia bacterium]|nr:plasmid pRiA4b ORF-3 family protein [Clostridia bacterium]
MGAYIVRIDIRYAKPPVWRRVAVPDKITFSDFSDIIQTVFGWDGYHLHGFETVCGYIEQVSPFLDSYGEGLPEDKIIIDDALGKMIYTYDFGDNWEHVIQFEKYDGTYDKRYATVLKWKGDNFSEDIGGIWSAMQLIEEQKAAKESPEDDEDEDEEEYEYDYDRKPTQPFSLEYTNAILATCCYAVSETDLSEYEDDEDY